MSQVDQYEQTNIEEASATVTYIGMVDDNGSYLVKQIDTTSDMVISFASILNNPTITSYAEAWAARADLTYGTYAQAVN